MSSDNLHGQLVAWEALCLAQRELGRIRGAFQSAWEQQSGHANIDAFETAIDEVKELQDRIEEILRPIFIPSADSEVT